MRIGYYAHHHGSGHCRQADKLAALLPSHYQSQLTVFTSLAADAYHFTSIAEEQIVRLSAEDELPDDVLAGRAGQYWQPASLHYSPVGNANIQTRSWQILNTIHERQIDLMIIDVSAEVAMLCRSASVPYLYVRLPGERDDIAHLSAFAGALGLLAPYPPALEAAATPDWVRQKTLYLDFLPVADRELLTYKDFIQHLINLTSTDNNASVQQRLDMLLQAADKPNQKKNLPLLITVIKGYGGHEAIDAKLPALRQALSQTSPRTSPQALIISLGPINNEMRDYVDIATEVDDVAPFIAHSDLLLMACGLNGIAQAYNYPTPLIVLPDARPHREQEVMAEALIAQGRALSWEQFMMQIKNEQLQSLIDSNKEDTDYKFNLEISLSAQKFMNSLIDYSLTKLWFREWLLPKLGLHFEV